jgi:hypothetical protein
MMIRNILDHHRSLAWSFASTLIVVSVIGARLSGQSRLTEPVYRVANETPAVASQPAAAPPTAVAQSPPAPPAPAPAAPRPAFDLTQQPDEHPLAPVIRVCKACVEHIDKDVPDYTCTLVKRERLNGELGEEQRILMRVRHEPFSVYMAFNKPHAGREVLFVDGQNKNELIVREAGLLGIAGKINLHPESTMAMSEQKYPITKVGMRNLLLELIRNFEADTKYTESEVTVNPKAEVIKRPSTMIQITHPIPRQNFRSHIARVFFDNELRVPIYYDAYMWPAKEGEAPPMEESYGYANLKINNGFTARDFDAEGGVIFK